MPKIARKRDKESRSLLLRLSLLTAIHQPQSHTILGSSQQSGVLVGLLTVRAYAVQADSGYDELLYKQLGVCPLVLVDARAKGTPEHAGWEEVTGAGEENNLTWSCFQGYQHP